MKAAAVSRAVLAAMTASLAACATAESPRASTLDGSRWQVTAIDGKVTPRTENYRLDFREGRISGKLGCNGFSGPYSLAGQTVTAGNVAATMMACPDPAESFEREGFAVLGQPMQLDWRSKTRLTLANVAGSIELERLD